MEYIRCIIFLYVNVLLKETQIISGQVYNLLNFILEYMNFKGFHNSLFKPHWMLERYLVLKYVL